MNFLNNSEIVILDWIQEHFKCDFLDLVMPLISAMADLGAVWIILAVVLICFKKTRRTGLTVGLSLIMSLLAGNLILKPLFARIRPYDINTDVVLLTRRFTDYSFPSGHTLASFCAAGSLMFTDRRIGYPALVIAILIALSRLYLYVHYPTDVAASIILGLCFAYISYRLVCCLNRKADKDVIAH